MLSGIRPAKIKFYLRFMREEGFAVGQVLAGSGLSEAALDDRFLLVSITQYVRVVANMRRLYGSLDLSFELGKKLTMGDLGILGHTIMTARSMAELLPLWRKYTPLFFGNLIQINFVHTSKSRTLIHYCPYPDLKADLLNFFLEENINFYLAVHRLIYSDVFPLQSMSLTYPAPPNKALYFETFGPDITFSAKHNLVRLKDTVPNLPLKGADPETNECCLRMMEELANHILARNTMSLKIKDLIYKRLRDVPNIDEISTKLHISTRTLMRKLNNEGLTYTDLISNVKQEVAENYLATTNYSSDEIAQKLGFSDVSSFRRFFKHCTGKTVSEYRHLFGIGS